MQIKRSFLNHLCTKFKIEIIIKRYFVIIREMIFTLSTLLSLMNPILHVSSLLMIKPTFGIGETNISTCSYTNIWKPMNQLKAFERYPELLHHVDHINKGAKMSHKMDNQVSATHCLQLLHMDIVGTMQTRSLS